MRLFFLPKIKLEVFQMTIYGQELMRKLPQFGCTGQYDEISDALAAKTGLTITSRAIFSKHLCRRHTVTGSMNGASYPPGPKLSRRHSSKSSPSVRKNLMKPADGAAPDRIRRNQTENQSVAAGIGITGNSPVSLCPLHEGL